MKINCRKLLSACKSKMLYPIVQLVCINIYFSESTITYPDCRKIEIMKVWRWLSWRRKPHVYFNNSRYNVHLLHQFSSFILCGKEDLKEYTFAYRLWLTQLINLYKVNRSSNSIRHLFKLQSISHWVYLDSH